jgi:hypothetical protein
LHEKPWVLVEKVNKLRALYNEYLALLKSDD